jgi:hypothetical protein
MAVHGYRDAADGTHATKCSVIKGATDQAEATGLRARGFPEIPAHRTRLLPPDAGQISRGASPVTNGARSTGAARG